MRNSDKPANAEIAASDLFNTAKLGDLTLPNRIVMAPLTRSRAQAGDVPGPLSAEYYAQRSSAGLIISEATQISPQGKGYAFTPGIYSDDQVEGWSVSTNAVHDKGGHIFAQLWHVGRISHPDLQPNGELPVAPSAIKPEGEAFTATGFKPFVTPRALALSEIPGIIDQYVHAAKCAKKAGFDGIEIHSANGYLLDQFIRDKTNKRTDIYGGSIENRTRLVLQVIEAVTKIWPSDRVGIRLSPVSPHIDIFDSHPMQTFSYLVEKLNQFNIAYIHCIEGSVQVSRESPPDFSFQELRKIFNGAYIANNCYDIKSALQARAKDSADFICFGRPFLANPDLVRRLYTGAKLAEAPKETWYGGGAHGYTDWPALE
jgi:N-ethylmaleimide reductase